VIFGTISLNVVSFDIMENTDTWVTCLQHDREFETGRGFEDYLIQPSCQTDKEIGTKRR
jgi:hypothetical protein